MYFEIQIFFCRTDPKKNYLLKWNVPFQKFRLIYFDIIFTCSIWRTDCGKGCTYTTSRRFTRKWCGSCTGNYKLTSNVSDQRNRIQGFTKIVSLIYLWIYLRSGVHSIICSLSENSYDIWFCITAILFSISFHVFHPFREVMVFYATFNNISVISWRLFLLVEETGENNRHWQTLSHNVVSSTPRHGQDANSQL